MLRAATCRQTVPCLSRLHWLHATKTASTRICADHCSPCPCLLPPSLPSPRRFGAEPQWAIVGETFPVGCRFHPAIRHSQFFSANPDRRKRLYSSPTGVYREGCGLGGVLMSWGAGEYLHLVLRLNRVALPAEALFCLRCVLPECCWRGGFGWGWAVGRSVCSAGCGQGLPVAAQALLDPPGA